MKRNDLATFSLRLAIFQLFFAGEKYLHLLYLQNCYGKIEINPIKKKM